MKVRIPNQIQQAARREVERQYSEEIERFTRAQARKEVFEADEQIFLDMDAAVLYALHKSCGFGKMRLERFYADFKAIYNELREFYLFGSINGSDGGSDFCWYADRELKKIGVDVKKLQERG